MTTFEAVGMVVGTVVYGILSGLVGALTVVLFVRPKCPCRRGRHQRPPSRDSSGTADIGKAASFLPF